MPVKSNIVIEDAHIGFRNFAGKASQYNPAGKRNFCVFLETELAKVLEEDGWNIRWLVPKNEDDDPQPYLQVAVSYQNIPPKIVMITSHGKTVLDEDSVELLDFAEIKEIDLIINPYNWTLQEGTKNEKSGTKAYVKAMYVTIVEDAFEAKYYGEPKQQDEVV
jgi:hypothetical protein